MSNPIPKPWAILLCRFSDDNNDPSTTTIADLAGQWRATASADFINGNLSADWDVDTRTFLQLYQELFTVTGIFSFNILQYFDAVTHGLIDLTGNQVFACKLDVKQADGGTMSRDDLFKKAKDA